VPIYRIYSSQAHDHMLTSDVTELAALPPGYVQESILGYVYYVSPSLTTPCVSTPSIVLPSSNEDFTLTESNLTARTVDLAHGVPGAYATWTLAATYTSPGGKGPFTGQQQEAVVGNFASKQHTFVGLGGQVNISVPSETGTVNRTVTVHAAQQIPASEITPRLVGLYTGPTSNLLALIAWKESTYLQWESGTLYNVAGLWPNEDYAGSGHFGLGQIGYNSLPAGYTVQRIAFNWLENTAAMGALFQEKLAIALSAENRMRAGKTLAALTALQRENMAILLYGPSPPHNDGEQYYVPQCNGGKGPNCNGGTWSWAVTTANNAGVTYVSDVRNGTLP
jgi:hypothetical protein